MSFAQLTQQDAAVELLQRSLARQRLGHAYLFSGDDLAHLELVARTLAKTLNCQQPPLGAASATDCCEACPSCRKIDQDKHADIQWIRPESKSRVITIDQMRDQAATVARRGLMRKRSRPSNNEAWGSFWWRLKRRCGQANIVLPR